MAAIDEHRQAARPAVARAHRARRARRARCDRRTRRRRRARRASRRRRRRAPRCGQAARGGRSRRSSRYIVMSREPASTSRCSTALMLPGQPLRQADAAGGDTEQHDVGAAFGAFENFVRDARQCAGHVGRVKHLARCEAGPGGRSGAGAVGSRHRRDLLPRLTGRVLKDVERRASSVEQGHPSSRSTRAHAHSHERLDAE